MLHQNGAYFEVFVKTSTVLIFSKAKRFFVILITMLLLEEKAAYECAGNYLYNGYK